MTRIFIVEDHDTMREMLQEYIGMETDMAVSSMAATGEEALEMIDREAPDLVLVDIALPDMSGIRLTELLRERYPALPLVMLTGHGERAYVDRAFDAGASGYVLKGRAEEIPAAVRRVMRGERYVSSVLSTPAVRT